MDYLKLDKVRKIHDAAATGRRRVIRPGPAEPARIHPARHDRRAVARFDQRGHRRLRWRHGDLGARRSERAPPRQMVPAAPPAAAGGTIRVALQRPVLDRPGRDAGPRRVRRHGPVLRIPVHPRHRSGSDIAPGLAEKWTPNADGTVWTFDLRQGVKWQDGRDFSSADVVATMERLVAAGNSGIKGVLEAGGRGRHGRRTPSRSTSPAATATSRTSSPSSTPRH